LQPSVALAEQFTVTRLDIKNNSGVAELKVKRTASFLHGKADPHPATDTWQARLTRQEQGWIALVPQDRIYLRPGLAFAVLANHLAVVSQAPADNQELKKLVRILDQLLSQNAEDTASGGSK
jgi:hypothetical protein